jgi:hypothetical protein
MAKVPMEERARKSQALMELFASMGDSQSTKKSPSQDKSK